MKLKTTEMSIKKKVVSVIIPTYNRSELLREAIESLIAQTYRPIECVVVDDGSSDETKKVVDKLNKLASKDFTLKYIYQTNSGSQVARNTGTKGSTGEFVQYLDSDDLLYPEKIEKQVNFLSSNVDCDGVFGDWEMGTVDEKESVQAWDSNDMLTQLLTERIIVNFSFLMRRQMVDKIGEWDINIKRNQEIDFQVRGVMVGGRFRHQKLICGLWRTHDGVRIGNSTTPNEYLNFFNKWETVLAKKQLFNFKISRNIANTYFWIAMQQNVTFEKGIRAILLYNAFRLNPDIPFANSRKMKLLNKFLPMNICIRLWLYWESINNSSTKL